MEKLGSVTYSSDGEMRLKRFILNLGSSIGGGFQSELSGLHSEIRPAKLTIYGAHLN